MLTSSELKKIPIFSCLNDANLEWLSQQTADIHLEPGEYLIHEGEPTPFFVLMEGITEVRKDVMGRQTEVSEHKQGDLCGWHGLFENNRHSKKRRACRTPRCRCTVCHD